MKSFIQQVLFFFRKRSAENLKRQRVKFFEKIIRGHYEELEEDCIVNVLNLYKKWLDREEGVFAEASEQALRTRGQKKEEQDWYSYFLEFTDEQPGADYTLLESDVFTEPFPSLHDMPEWALATKATDLVTLLGLNDHQNYLLVIKNHLVNHALVRGVIQFDFYQKC